MATRCPDCGNFMRLIGTDDDENGKHRSHYWCGRDGTYLTIPGSKAGAARIKRPEMAKAYTEFDGFLTRKQECMRQTWRTIFFKYNDSREIGVCIGAIMGVHAIVKKALRWGFDVSTTSCTLIRFDYESNVMAIQDRARLLLVIEDYHVSDAEN